VEDAPEMLAVREHLVLLGEERAARVHQIDAGQSVLQRDLLSAKVLLHRDRVVGSTFDRRVVDYDRALPTGARSAPGDEARSGRPVDVHAVSGELGELE